MSPSHASPVLNQRKWRTALSVIKLLQNDAKERYRDWTFPSNPQLVKHTFAFEHKNIQFFSKQRRMRLNYSQPACQCNKDRSSHRTETASHTFLLGQTFQVQLTRPGQCEAWQVTTEGIWETSVWISVVLLTLPLSCLISSIIKIWWQPPSLAQCFLLKLTVFDLDNPCLQSPHRRETNCAYLSKCPKMYQSWSACR